MDQRLHQLISMLRGSGQQPAQQPQTPPPGMQPGMQPQMPQMGGMAGQAQQSLQTFIPAYKQHQIQAMESGQQPMPFEQFIQQMQGGR